MDIAKLVESMKHPMSLSKYPSPRPSVPARPVYTSNSSSNNFPNSAHHLPKPPTPIPSPPPTISTPHPVIRNTPGNIVTIALLDPPFYLFIYLLIYLFNRLEI